MESGQLRRALQHIQGFQGVFAKDELPKVNKDRQALYVVNTHPSCFEGEHWIAIYFPPEGLPEFFDSFARIAFAKPFRKLLGKVYLHNRMIVQSPKADTCGQHVIYYANERNKGIPFNDIKYTRSLQENDQFVKEYARKMEDLPAWSN